MAEKFSIIGSLEKMPLDKLSFIFYAPIFNFVLRQTYKIHMPRLNLSKKSTHESILPMANFYILW